MDQTRTGALIRALRQQKHLTHPEWDAQTRLPYFAHGTLLWYCTRHGLFAQKIDAHKK